MDEWMNEWGEEPWGCVGYKVQYWGVCPLWRTLSQDSGSIEYLCLYDVTGFFSSTGNPRGQQGTQTRQASPVLSHVLTPFCHPQKGRPLGKVIKKLSVRWERFCLAYFLSFPFLVGEHNVWFLLPLSLSPTAKTQFWKRIWKHTNCANHEYTCWLACLLTHTSIIIFLL